jgi:hypothetical protein
VNDCEQTSAPATVEINVVSVNDNPEADTQTVETFEELPVNITLTGTDPENDPLFFTLVSTPTHGTLTGMPPNLTYSPAADFAGSDSLNFITSDGHLSSVPAAVSIEVIPVNDPPVAYQQSITTLQNFTVNILLAGFDMDGDVLTFNVVDGPSHGTLGGAAAERIYSPEQGFIGPDSFSFVVTDGLVESTPAVVGITVSRTIFMPMVSR